MDDEVQKVGENLKEEILYEVKWSSELGRYLVAVRDISPREIIIREDPLISGLCDRGPKEFPVCLGCCGVMDADPMSRCTKCRWPVCNEECEKLPSHASNECLVFQANRVVYPPPHGWPTISKSIYILRCLLLKFQKPSEWECLMNMSDNKDFRRGRPNCINSDKKILENFEKFFPQNAGLPAGTICGDGDGSREEQKGFLEEEVIRVSGIIDVNAHAFPLKVNDRSTYACNLYSKTSLLAHSCCPNSSWSPDKSLSRMALTVRANVPIGKGQTISVAYDEGQLLLCTLKRLIPNEINGMFICKCERCRDPTELGTFIGALKCPSCPNGYLLPIDPVDSFSSWKCDNGSHHPQNVSDDDKENNSSDTFRHVLDQEKNSKTDNDDHHDVNLGIGNEGSGDSHCNLILDDENVIEIMQDAESTCGYTKIDLVTNPPLPEGDEEQQDSNETLGLLKEFVEDYSKSILHPNHYILQEVNVRIIKMEYRKVLDTLSDSDLIQYLERCERLLRVSDILTPGYCEYRAFLQYHISQGLLALERRREGKTMTERNQWRRPPQEEKRNIKHEMEKKGECNNDVSREHFEQPESKLLLHHAHHDSDDDGTEEGDGNDVHDSNDGDNKGVSDGNDESICGKTMRDCCFEDTPYGNTRQNHERLLEMLTFLMTFFKEINPSHKLLKPISDTVMETERKVKLLRRKKV